jgi:hypothetical protein
MFAFSNFAASSGEHEIDFVRVPETQIVFAHFTGPLASQYYE